MAESELVHAILKQYGNDPRLRIWRSNSGVAYGAGRAVRFGIPGQADISGILRNGQRIEIECKTATGRQSPGQKAFQAMIQRFNGVYILARCVEDISNVIADC